jgi:hypothetical protein
MKFCYLSRSQFKIVQKSSIINQLKGRSKFSQLTKNYYERQIAKG